MKFIGIDLGWLSGATGLCCLQWQDNHLVILDFSYHSATEDIFCWLDSWVKINEPAMVAVDAPTIITNQVGMRLADRLVQKSFSRYHAGCYPANLSRPFAQRTVEFGRSLEAKGFVHAPSLQPQALGRYQIEVFPHPATIHLFGLNKILKYKKGKIADKKIELEKLRYLIVKVLPNLEPGINLDSLALIPSIPRAVRGVGLKEIEDKLDSLLCAYIGAYWWYWGIAKNWVLGKLDTGYIVIPAPLESVKAKDSRR